MANGYSRGVDKAKATNLNRRSAIYAFLSERDIKSPEDLKAFIEKRTAWLEKQDMQIEKIKTDYERSEQRLILGRTYKKYKDINEEYQSMYFGKKKFYAEHEKEIKAFKRAERKLKESMPDLEGIDSAISGDEHYLKERDAKIAEVKERLVPVKDELKKLKEIQKHMTKAFEILGLNRETDNAGGGRSQSQSQSIQSNLSDDSGKDTIRNKLQRNKEAVKKEQPDINLPKRNKQQQDL